MLALRLRLDQLRVDLRHAVRGLLRQKTFTITAVTTLALALGPATAVFSLINGVLFDPLPKARDLDRVVFAWAANPGQNRHEFPWSELNFLDHRAQAQGLSALAAITGTSATIGGTVPQQVNGAWVSTDMFDVLGIAPSRGRRFTEADMQPGAPPTIILGHDYAQTRFAGSDPIGQTLIIDGRSTAVIGVLPKGFRYPADDADFWQPLVIDRADSNRGQTYLTRAGTADRRAPRPRRSSTQMNAVAIDLEKKYPDSNSGSRVEIVPATEQLTRGARRIVRVLGFAAIAIFLLACTNIASLLVVRTSAAKRNCRSAPRWARAPRGSLDNCWSNISCSASVAAVAALGVAAGLLRLLELTRLVPAHQIQRASLDAAAITFLVGTDDGDRGHARLARLAPRHQGRGDRHRTAHALVDA